MRQCTIVLVAIVCLTATANAQSVEDFYKSNPITMLVGSGAGGGYDVYARAFARHWERSHPGSSEHHCGRTCRRRPGLRPRRASITAPERDGSRWSRLPTNRRPRWIRCSAIRARIERRLALEIQLAGQHRQARKHLRHLAHQPGKDHRRCARPWRRHRGAARRRHLELRECVPKMLNALIGTRFKVVSGYDGTVRDLTMAVERGEAEGICGLSWSTMKASRPHWIKDNLLNVIVQMGLAKLRDLPDVPSALDLVEDPANRQVMELILIRQETRAGRLPRRRMRSRRPSVAAGAPGLRGDAGRSRIRRRGGEDADGDRADDRRCDCKNAGKGLRRAESHRRTRRRTGRLSCGGALTG